MADNGTIEIKGLDERIKQLGEASTKNPMMRKRINEVVRAMLAEVRKNLQDDAQSGLGMESDPTVTALTEQNAGDLIDRAGGVKVRVRATCMQKFTDLLEAENYQTKRVGIETKAYIAKTNNDSEGDNGGNGGSNTGGGGHTSDDGDIEP